MLLAKTNRSKTPSTHLKTQHLLKRTRSTCLKTNPSTVNIIDACTDQKLFIKTMTNLLSRKKLAITFAFESIPDANPEIGTLLVRYKTGEKKVPKVSSNKYHWNEYQLVGVSIFHERNKVYYFSLNDVVRSWEVLEFIKNIFNNPDITVVKFDCKEQLKMFYRCTSIEYYLQSSFVDPKVVDWLLHSRDGEKSLTTLAELYIPSWSKVINMGGKIKYQNSLGRCVDNGVDGRLRSAVESLVSWFLMEEFDKKITKLEYNFNGILGKSDNKKNYDLAKDDLPDKTF